VSVYGGGIRHGNLNCGLDYVFFHLHAEQEPGSAVGGSSEAALSLTALSCGLHEALCICCKSQVLFLTPLPIALRKRNGVCKLSTWINASLGTLNRRFGMQPLVQV